MKIRWEVGDGYAGKARPQYVEVPDDELEGLTESEQEAVIDEYVNDAFTNCISYYWDRNQLNNIKK